MAARWLAKVATSLLSLLLAFGVVEFAFRLLWLKRFTVAAGIEHSHFHHRYKPYTTYHFATHEFDVTMLTNRYGLRGPDPVLPKPAGVVRILMLGDSFTFGFPVKDEETFCSLIERALQAKGYPVDVVNGGVSGYAPSLEYISLRDEYLTFEPDLVILWYDFGDLQEDSWFQKNLVHDETGKILRADPRFNHERFDYWEWLNNHSALAKYFNNKVVRTVEKIRVLGLTGYVKTILRGERAKVAIARVKTKQRAQDLAESDRFLLLRETSTKELLEPYWALDAKYLRMIRDLLAEHDIPFMVGIYPYGMLVGPDQWVEGRTFWGFEKGKTYSADVALALFNEFSTHEQIPFVNTIGSFRQAAASEKLFFDHDGHMTPAGHRVLANHLGGDPQFLRVLRRQLAHRKAAEVTRTGREPSPGVARPQPVAVGRP